MRSQAAWERVAGVAAAAGAGLAIGLALSAPAAADTADPSATGTRVTNRVSPVAGTAAKSTPALPGRPARRNQSPAPAAAAAHRAQASALGLNPLGQRIRVFQGTHVALPLNWAFFTKKVSGSATFTPDTAYDLGDADQYDWNKLTGIAFSPLQHDRNSAMVAWRYDLDTRQFQIAPFYNVDKKRILPDEQTEVISVPADQTFTYTVDYTGITVSYGGRTVSKAYPEGLIPNQWTASRVSGWFGGNRTAPRTVSYYLKLQRP